MEWIWSVFIIKGMEQAGSIVHSPWTMDQKKRPAFAGRYLYSRILSEGLCRSLGGFRQVLLVHHIIDHFHRLVNIPVLCNIV